MRHDDWQDAALSQRHVHNRVNRSGGKAKQGAFDAKKAFGSYKLECKAYVKHVAKEDTSLQQPTLELYRFTDDQQGLVGHISFPKCFEGTVLLAGSRKTLNKIINGLGEELEQSADEAISSPVDDDKEVSTDGAEEAADKDEEDDSEEEDEEEQERNRISTFEKNSFRSPKFWLRWQADVTSSPDKEKVSETVHETNSGYLVFAGNDCRKFTGTISCEGLGWNNASVTGWKLKGRSEQDIAIEWKKEETT